LKKYSLIFASVIMAVIMSASFILVIAYNPEQSGQVFAPPIVNPVFAPSQAATFAFVGDLGCGASANQTLAQIGAVSPSVDRLILLGDYSYQNDWQCFQKQLVGQDVDGKVHGPGNSFKVVVVGNH
jgi:hypothetical protein